ncbi:MAG TPA: AsmA family protein [Candidatus Acidoferrales bacterium]|nr:AsmA family protein [Candidatus Acidoferrales bacterium]
MTKRKRRVLIGLGAIVGVVAIAAGIFIATLDSDRLKTYIAAAVTKATGRQFSIKGDLNIDLGWISRLQASQIQFQNAEWSKHPQMLEVGMFEVELDVRQLLKWRLVFPAVTIAEPKLILEKNAAGAANWDFRAASPTEPAAPEKRGEFPVIEKLIVKDGTVLFSNQETKAHLELKLAEAEAAGFLEKPVKLTAKGSYQKLPLDLSFGGGSYENLRSTDEPYPVEIDLSVGRLKAKVKGNLTEPLQMKGEDLTLDIRGDDMANLFPLIRLVFPSTPPYQLKGHLKHEGNLWSFSNFSGRVGDSDLSGNIHVDLAPKRHLMKAELVSNRLDFDDLAGFIGGRPKADESEGAPAEKKKISQANKKKPAASGQDGRIFPDQPYDLERLNAMDAEVSLRAKHILAPNLPIDNLNGKLSLKEGVLRFEPAAFGVAGGRAELYSTFDASARPAKVKIDLRARKLDLKRFLANSQFAQKTLGPIGGRVNLAGAGQSFAQLMGSASGDIFLAMTGGEISGLLVELAGLDIFESVGALVKGDKPVPIRCALLDLRGTDGQMAVQTMAFDTTDTVIYGEGKIDLANERVNLVITPVPKDFSPLSLRSYIRVTGPFSNVSVFPDPLKTGTESLLAKMFNVLVMLGLSPLQPRDLWFGRDVDCDGLLARLQEKDPKGVILKDLYTEKGSAPPAQQPAMSEPRKPEPEPAEPAPREKRKRTD